MTELEQHDAICAHICARWNDQYFTSTHDYSFGYLHGLIHGAILVDTLSPLSDELRFLSGVFLIRFGNQQREAA